MFDKLAGDCWYDGKLMPLTAASVPLLTHGLHYASVVFEGSRSYGGEIFELHAHSLRLRESARILGFDIPWSTDEISSACQQVVERNGGGDQYIRPVAWRGSETMGVSARSNTIHLAVASWDMGNYFSNKERGVALLTSKWRRPSPDTAPTHSKAAGLYMICTLSKHEAEDSGYDDALMLDYRGYVAEGTGANIFFLIDDKLHTPIPDCFLDGITRRAVMALARKKGIDIVERYILPDDIAQASEVFLTGTAAEVTFVRSIDNHHFQPGRLSAMLSSAYADHVRGR